MVKLIRSPGAKPQSVVNQIFSDLLAAFSIDRRRPQFERLWRKVAVWLAVRRETTATDWRA